MVKQISQLLNFCSAWDRLSRPGSSNPGIAAKDRKERKKKQTADGRRYTQIRVIRRLGARLLEPISLRGRNMPLAVNDL